MIGKVRNQVKQMEQQVTEDFQPSAALIKHQHDKKPPGWIN